MTDDLRARLQEALGPQLQLEAELAPGGMSRVFVARDTELGRKVVAKVLDPRLAPTLSGERFGRETRLTARLQHPNIVPVLGTGECDGLPYYTMPFVDGQSLRARIEQGGAMPVVEAVRILRDVAAALAFAHERGVVHRDIKPENILLAGHTATVTDFGIAKALTAAVVGDAPETPLATLTEMGMSLGTPAYVAPEQVTGSPVDSQADVYSWGVVAYEVLAGAHPFAGKQTAQQMIAAHITEAPAPLRSRRPDVPSALADLVDRSLAKEPAARPAGGAELEHVLEHLGVGAAAEGRRRASPNPLRWSPRVRLGLAVGAAGLVAAIMLGSSWRQTAWARDDAIPTIMRLADELEFDEAVQVVQRARAALGSDSALEAAAELVLFRASFSSEPSGARVFRQRYRGTDTSWMLLGVTPLDSVEVPRGPARYRIELEGFAPYVAGRAGNFILRAADDTSGNELIDFPQRQVGRNDLPNGIRHIDPPVLPAFAMGRYEVTNEEYKRFVDAGGYTRPEFWDASMRRNGTPVSWEQSRTLLVDRTGLAGPATWEAGTYPFGQDRHPVRGVSWYEARAYARFAGLELPTVFHWSSVAALALSHFIISESNVNTDSVRAVGQTRGITPGGLFELAGNVREWSANAMGDQRFVLGGAFDEPAYMYLYAIATDPFNRAANIGFRVARYDLPADSPLFATLSLTTRDFTKEHPADDAVFDVYRRLYDYDPVPLHQRLVEADTFPEWIWERVAFRVPYAGEEMIADVFLPRDRRSPYQTAVYFPGSDAIQSAPLRRGRPPLRVENVVRSGRALIVPQFKGTWERSDALTSRTDRTTRFYRDRIMEWAKEVRTTVDYLHTRGDVDTTRLIYVGVSMGGRVAPINLVAEQRFKTAILVCPGIGLDATLPEIDPLHFLPRVKIPLLMVGGKLDGVFPLETSQTPYFEFLGTPADSKRFVEVESGHCPSRDAFFREALPWLDRYLGRPR